MNWLGVDSLFSFLFFLHFRMVSCDSQAQVMWSIIELNLENKYKGDHKPSIFFFVWNENTQSTPSTMKVFNALAIAVVAVAAVLAQSALAQHKPFVAGYILMSAARNGQVQSRWDSARDSNDNRMAALRKEKREIEM